MAFRIGRTLPPAASPIYPRDIVSGITGLCRGEKTVTKFKEELREYFNVRHCYTVSSGKTSLTVILQSLKAMFPDRDEVLIPAFTCYSVPSAIIRAGLRIRLCDLDRDNFDFDYEQLGHILSNQSDRLLCILPVHLFGLTADVARIRNMVADKDIVIVEDAAQAMGGESEGRKLGTLGDVGFFSLGRGKALSTVEGGIVITGRDDIAEHLGRTVHELPNYGALELVKVLFYAVALAVLLRPSLFWLPRALPFLRLGETIYDPNFKIRKMSAFQAGLAKGWERKLRVMQKTRSENVRGLLERLETLPPWVDKGTLPDLLRLPLRIDSVQKRASIVRTSEQSGLGLACTYPDSVDRIPELKTHFSSFHYPAARENAEKLLTLPIHPYLTSNDMDRIEKLLQREEEPTR
jgi:dTDP-4-amino-4,6-dideoxygalactose transaminase